MDNNKKLTYFRKLTSQLKNERSSFDPLYRDLAKYIDPSRAQFSITDNNRGDRRNHDIIDSTATFAADVLGAGMTSGITSPARPWFALTTQDPDLAKYGKVKQWLQDVRDIMTATNNRSNVYSTLPNVYKDAGIFGTAPFLMEEEFTGNVFHTTPFDLGTYYIGEDSFGRVNTFVREFRMTVQQLVDKFATYKDGKPDWSNFSNVVKTKYESGNTQDWIEVTHVIAPNREHNPRKFASKFKKFASVYFEKSNNEEKFLREKGYDLFPVLCPRWNAKAGDVYGTSCPGMNTLGDVKQLQHGELRTAEGLDKLVRPPMKASSTIMNNGANLLPGGVTWIDGTNQDAFFEPVMNINFPFNQVEAKQEQIRKRINEAFHKDLFLMLANDYRSNITAREIDARHEERLMMLGPVLWQFNSDGLDPFIDLSFDYHLRQGMLPPPPEELQGMPLKIEYISIVAQAQKALGINGLDRFLTFVSGAAAMNPGIMDKVDFDAYVDDYADQLSINPKIVRPTDLVQAMRMQQAEAQAQAQQVEMAQAQAKTAKDLSQTNLDGNNALSAMVGEA